MVSVQTLHTRIAKILDIKWGSIENPTKLPRRITYGKPPEIFDEYSNNEYHDIYVYGGSDDPDTWFQGRQYWHKITFNIDVISSPNRSMSNYEDYYGNHNYILEKTLDFMSEIVTSNNVANQITYEGLDNIQLKDNPMQGSIILYDRIKYLAESNSEYVVGDYSSETPPSEPCPPDLIKPTISNGTYTTGDGVITLSFHENLMTFTPSLMSLTDGTTTLTMSGGTLSGNVVKFTLSETNRLKFLNAPSLIMTLSTNAVKDNANNFLQGISFFLTIQDTEKPKFVSGIYNRNTGLTTLNFTETINTFDGTKLTLKSGSLNASLSSAASKSGSILTETLSGTNKTQFDSIDSMSLDIDGGAITDESNNEIEASTDNAIVVSVPDPLSSIAFWGRYSLDNTLNDTSGNSRTLSGSGSYLTGKYGQSFKPGRFSTLLTHTWARNSDYDICFWFYMGINSSSFTFYKNNQFYVRLNQTNPNITLNSTTHTLSGITRPTAGTWTFIRIRFDYLSGSTGNFALYVGDGSWTSNNTSSGSTLDNRFVFSGQRLDNRIDNLAIKIGSLFSESEVTAIKDNGL